MTRIITVSTRTELTEALRTATGGETIKLASGNYGNLALIDRATFDLTFPSTVKITAADPGNPPVITGLDLRFASNLSFEGITFDYTYQDGQPIWAKPFKVSGSTDIAFQDCTFDGDVARGLTAADNGFPTGFALNITGSVGVTVADCEISGFYRGTVIGGSGDVTVSGNDIHGIRMDGMNFSAVQGVVIENNHIHDFARSMNSSDHSDMIQFWTNGTTRPSTDIVIRGNLLDIGGGNATQSIFMRNDMVDRGFAGAEMFYRNVTIEENVIINGHSHGITVGETAGLTIRSNSVLHADGAAADGVDSAVEIPRISVAGASTGVNITHNATSAISGYTGQAGWHVRQNAFVQDQDPNSPGWYGDVFVASTMVHNDGNASFSALPGGMLDVLGAGATATLVSAKTDVLDAAFHMEQGSGGRSSRVFDAGVTQGADNGNATYHWNFGDGTSAEGRTVSHTYENGGNYDVTLTVTLSDGRVDREKVAIAVDTPELLRLGSDGAFILSADGQETVLGTTAPVDADGDIQLGGTGVVASVARSHLAPIFGSDDVTISLDLDADRAGATGEVFRLQGSIVVSVNSRGELQVRAWSSEGDAVSLISTGKRINDGQNHDLDIQLEGGRLSLWVDGAMASDTAFAGMLANIGRHNLTFGNPWGASAFQGDLADFTIIVDDCKPDAADSITSMCARPPEDIFTATAVDLSPPLL